MSETTQTTKHTPGPWHVTGEIDRFYSGEWIRAEDAKTGTLVAVSCDFNRYDRDAEREANARLIAAAPDLLYALRHALAVIQEQRDWWERQGHVVSGMPGCSDHERVSIWSALETGRRAIEKATGAAE